MLENATLVNDVRAIHRELSGLPSVELMTAPRHGTASVDDAIAWHRQATITVSTANRAAYRLVPHH
jgi:hypothetical protein